MTRDDIIRMAREAGLMAWNGDCVLTDGQLERLAALAHAAGEQAERDRTKRLVEDMQNELRQRRMTGRNT